MLHNFTGYMMGHLIFKYPFKIEINLYSLQRLMYIMVHYVYTDGLYKEHMVSFLKYNIYWVSIRQTKLTTYI